MSGFCNCLKGQRILEIVERLRLGSSKRLTVNVIRNQPAIGLAGQQRNRTTLDETNLASPRVMEYVSSQVIGLRLSFTTSMQDKTSVMK
jgi:hypothetical protein